MTCSARSHVEACGDCNHLASDHRSKTYGGAFECPCGCALTDVTPTYPICNVTRESCLYTDYDKWRSERSPWRDSVSPQGGGE